MAPVMIALEGLQGCGKSTQVRALCSALHRAGVSFRFTEWNSHKWLHGIIRSFKVAKTITPLAHCVFHALDHAFRLRDLLRPPVPALLIFDRHVHTAFARDSYRGVEWKTIEQAYEFCPHPDRTFFLRSTPEQAAEQRSLAIERAYFHSCGLDVTPELAPRQAFLRYQRHQVRVYGKLCELRADTMVTLDGNQPIDLIHQTIWGEVQALLERTTPGKAEAFGELQAEAARLRESLGVAKHWLDRAATTGLDPGGDERLTALGMAASSLQRPRDALLYFTQAYDAAPSAALAAKAGTAAKQIGDLDCAEQWFREAVERSSLGFAAHEIIGDESEYCALYADVLLRQGNAVGATQAASQALSRAPDDALALTISACTLALAGDVGGALEMMRRGLSLHSSSMQQART